MNLVFLVGLVQMLSETSWLVYGLPVWTRLVLSAPWLMAGTTLAMVVGCALAERTDVVAGARFTTRWRGPMAPWFLRHWNLWTEAPRVSWNPNEIPDFCCVDIAL
jgi:hypothetical protein